MKQCPSHPEPEPHGEQASLAAKNCGKKYWRGIEELADSPVFQEMIEREFPDDAGRWSDPVTRRQFLTLMAASLAVAGVNGCSPQPPVRRIMPYTRQPENIVPGKPQFFATTMTLGGLGLGLVVKSHEGRPVKIEGNPKHPASLGATDVFAQAAILGLYDPDRSQSITKNGQPRGWSDAQLELRPAFQRLRERAGRGLRVLTESVSSPTLYDQIAGERRGSLLREFPEARWIQFEPARSVAPLVGTRMALGRAVQPVFDFREADVVVSLGADFLSCRGAGVRHSHDFMQRRREVTDGAERRMNRLYAVETTPTSTGAVADHRLPLAPREIEAFALELARKLGVSGLPSDTKVSEQAQRWIAAIAKDLQSRRERSLIVAGEEQPASVHALACAMNDALGAVGKTLQYIPPPIARPIQHLDDLRQLVDDLRAGQVDTLLICGANPVFTAPADFNFSAVMQKAPVCIHLGLYQDETAAQCHWHIPEAHFLESWSDARSYDGTASIIQPLIAPLYGGITVHEMISACVDNVPRPSDEIVRSYWRENWPARIRPTELDGAWHDALSDGLIAGSAPEPLANISLQSNWARGAFQDAPQQTDSQSIEVVFRPDPTIYDGRFANNGWLQELPKPITKLTWDNAVFVSPRMAERLSLSQTFGNSSGEHGQAIVDRVALTLYGRTIEAPAWILPGHAENAVTLNFGYGRTQAGRVGNETGFDAYKLRTSQAPWSDAGVEIRKLDDTYTLACTQMHHAMEGRAPVREGTYEQYKADRDFLAEKKEKPAENDPRLQPLTLYPEYDYSPSKNKWGMSINLSTCTGCSACVVACQAENNIPVVGKTEVTRGREMHWLRIDRYYRGDLDNPTTLLQPVPCMQCENAPCELVCPVAATAHSADGLNDMVYNRCVGTRYCQNNCPYKVRRFNFLAYADFTTESLKLGHNPQVTVRSRGVMEKCTYCVQRIRTGQIHSELSGTPIHDGDVKTACQQACPTQAIIFGDMNDANSEVSTRKALPLDYSLLEELNTKPRTTYLAALRNPNPELDVEARPA